MKTLRIFFEGFDRRDGEIVKEAFHPKAFLYDTTKEGFQGTPIWIFCNNFLPTIKSLPDHPWNQEICDKKAEILDITGDAAVAKVQWIFSFLTMTDYYTMLKVENKWYIMNKVWHNQYHYTTKER